MLYRSTRDKDSKLYPFTHVLLKGLSDDGGLFVPDSYPSVSKDELIQLSTKPYHELAFHIIHQFVGDAIPQDDLQELLKNTYKKESFGSDDICPSVHLYDNVHMLDLSSGPSLAFKDMAMQFLGQILEYELKRQHTSLTIVGASSGDTVSSAEEALKGKDNINVVMLTPKQGMSPFQKAQAGSILDKNIYNLSVEGPFDLCQDFVKAINNDLEFKNKHNIGAVNSINWARICAQVVYYFKGYLSTVSEIGKPLDICVPSGNFGNILAAYIAKQMGLPLNQLIVATNENNVLDTFFKTGLYKQQAVHVTSSPSMDISKASNIERLFFDLLSRDASACSELMKTFETKKEIDLSDHLDTLQNKLGFSSSMASHQNRLDCIRDVYEKSKIVIDPHTAAGIYVANTLKDKNTPILCMETAKPTKFEECIQEALGFTPERPDSFKNLESKPQRFFDVDASDDAIKRFIESHV